MSRWLAFHGKPIYLDELIYQSEHSLIHQTLEERKSVNYVNGDGFGLAWYSKQDIPGRYHEISPAWADDNLRSLTHHICSHRFMAHVRFSTGAEVSRANCHPFIYEQWMFLHNGQIGGFDKVRFTLERLLTEELYNKRVGTTDSEIIFLLMIKNGLQIDPIAAINQTMYEIEQAMLEKEVTLPLHASICISDGDSFWVIRYSTDNVAPTIYIKQQPDSVTLASEPLEQSNNWLLMPKQQILHIDRRHSLTFYDLIVD
ncbi:MULTISPECIES: class II glutamine amidotransferase [unclassified Photobacterium]|uniref:class II glutamine amidotransferase n=1 Tax=unclassified Photobacterium TaxID=2628852 RepID=UPI001EDF4498|nr:MULTISPECIES: class II glutamine amidotransferase [unclassified Photobacterium]MCG3866089.1 class II glutamine amidotransferase [Photobacterium sp. Ph6]MCG3877618.1 class II glutamine amidotransferase [Photobacterium sp. Ph5]